MHFESTVAKKKKKRVKGCYSEMYYQRHGF